MLCAEARIDKGFFPYEPGLPDAMIHNDHLGTPQKLTDSTGAVVWSADYKSFGEATITVSTITNNLRFPGQYYDVETGLNYNYFRDYNPVIGRYIEADPLNRGMLQIIFRDKVAAIVNYFNISPNRQHLFSYVGNNPIKRQDSFGLFFEVFIAGRGPFVFRPLARISRMPRQIPQEAQRMCRQSPPRNTPTPELGPPTPSPAPTSPWAEFLQNVADLLDELFSSPPVTPYDPNLVA